MVFFPCRWAITVHFLTGPAARDAAINVERFRNTEHLRPILHRSGIEGSMWCDLVWNFKRYFGRCAGSPTSLQSSAVAQNRHWLRGQRAAKLCFTGN